MDNFLSRTAFRRDKIEFNLKSLKLEETVLPQLDSPTFSRADKISGAASVVNGIFKSFSLRPLICPIPEYSSN